MKFEQRSQDTNLLESEAYRLLYLKGEGIPEVYSYGNDRLYNILIIELLNKTLQDFLVRSGKPISIVKTLHVGIQMIQRLKYIHDLNHVHRDIKPDNFMNGLGLKENMVYLIDYGLTKKYRSSKTHEHIKYRIHKRMTGTIRYASINASRYCEHSRRDDLESVGYVLLFLLKGSLPWQGLVMQEDEDRCKKVLQRKREVKVTDLCKGVPNQMILFIEHCRGLKFEEEPNYDYLIGLLSDVIEGKTILSKMTLDYVKTKSTYSKAETSTSINNLNYMSDDEIEEKKISQEGPQFKYVQKYQ